MYYAVGVGIPINKILILMCKQGSPIRYGLYVNDKAKFNNLLHRKVIFKQQMS